MEFEGITEYTYTEADVRRLDATFTYHEPKGDQARRYALLRASARAFAEAMLTYCPPSRERSLALTELEIALMQANAAIARNE
jgi:hypothetical protein